MKADAVALCNPPSPYPAQLAQHVSLVLPQPLIVSVCVCVCSCYRYVMVPNATPQAFIMLDAHNHKKLSHADSNTQIPDRDYVETRTHTHTLLHAHVYSEEICNVSP